MPNRSAVVVGAALALAVLDACTSRPQALPSSTASVAINGHVATMNLVMCHQLEWYHTIDIGGGLSGATVVIEEGPESTAVDSVRINNVGGFSGLYSRHDGASKADMRESDDNLTITGIANGYKTDQLNEPATATFKLTAVC